MSSDSGSKGVTGNPISGMEPPKSKKKLWIFGGLGCLGLIGICCVGIVTVAMLYVYRPMQEFQNENVTMATSSPEVEAILGSPVTSGVVTQQSDGSGGIIFKAELTGPNGSGTLVFKGMPGEPLGEPWTRDSIYLEAKGQQTDLDPDAIFDIDIDDGL